MIEIYPQLFIGNESDYEFGAKHQPDWTVVHACKEPYHRLALGYTGRSAPNTHPEYLIARRGNRLILNLIDAADSAYIPKEVIEAAVEFIHSALQSDQRVLVHCNQGLSRSPMIGLLYLARFTKKISATDFVDAEREFLRLYPPYQPAAGIRGFVLKHWDSYRSRA